MTEEANPSIFAVSVVFGGIVGMAAASLFGVEPGGGFIVGVALVFLLLSIATILSRELALLALVGVLKTININEPKASEFVGLDRRQLNGALAELLQAVQKLQKAVRDRDKVRRS